MNPSRILVAGQSRKLGFADLDWMYNEDRAEIPSANETSDRGEDLHEHASNRIPAKVHQNRSNVFMETPLAEIEVV